MVVREKSGPPRAGARTIRAQQRARTGVKFEHGRYHQRGQRRVVPSRPPYTPAIIRTMDAPRWCRCSVWRLEMPREHGTGLHLRS
jgi:hypothetical protein